MTANYADRIAGVFGDEERAALDRDYREHADWLRSTARRSVGSLQAAEDLVQEAFIRVARYPPERRQARPLLRRILSNLIKDRFRSNARERSGLNALTGVLSGEEVSQSDHSDVLALSDMLLGMPEPLRDVFLLSRFTPLSQAEIAKRLGISVKTVEWRLARGLQYCVAHLEK